MVVTITLPNAFQVTPGTGPQTYFDIIGRNVIRGGKKQRFQFVVGNRGNVDAALVPLFIKVPSYFVVELKNPLITPPHIGALDYRPMPGDSDGGEATVVREPSVERRNTLPLPVPLPSSCVTP